MASADGVNVSKVESAPLMKAADPVGVNEAQSSGRKWKFLGAAAIAGVIAAVCIVGLAALMVPQVTAALGLSAGALMITNLSLAVVGTVSFFAVALILTWGAKPQASAKEADAPAPAATVAPAADATTAADAASKADELASTSTDSVLVSTDTGPLRTDDSSSS